MSRRIKMFAIPQSTVFLLLLSVHLAYLSVPEDESCHSYAGGSVYPTGVSKEETEHKLQWTKAVSKLGGKWLSANR